VPIWVYRSVLGWWVCFVILMVFLINRFVLLNFLSFVRVRIRWLCVKMVGSIGSFR